MVRGGGLCAGGGRLTYSVTRISLSLTTMTRTQAHDDLDMAHEKLLRISQWCFDIERLPSMAGELPLTLLICTYTPLLSLRETDNRMDRWILW